HSTASISTCSSDSCDESTTSRVAYRRMNSTVVSRRRFVRNPRTNLRDAGVAYLSSYARSTASRMRSPRTRAARTRTSRSPTWIVPRIVEERAIPPARRLLPRAREYAAADDDRPHADEAMIRSGAGADAQNLDRV